MGRIKNTNKEPMYFAQSTGLSLEVGQLDRKLDKEGATLVDDCALQLAHNGSYLDLESTLAEQRDELEGFQEEGGRGKKHSIILRTQLSVRVHACIGRLPQQGLSLPVSGNLWPMLSLESVESTETQEQGVQCQLDIPGTQLLRKDVDIVLYQN
ncbi:FH1/FH2 domain-containing protein 3 Formactin-2 Formin -like protein overexpressed in spleen 2 [Channa argus]|uniref:FH1/FH2 domain-containing protein 3 Formactin-2 Formin-like protein overexpressed in spleen 2 n=1 Tax=Channa argus TaxID=215402 RepID=A0A6G1PNC6_CHAAH|nr:FH1/FH2 domain-containing protein 3 Formactin-2 Formin -like protein overexpressed in spleen 2 [Channa argus]